MYPLLFPLNLNLQRALPRLHRRGSTGTKKKREISSSIKSDTLSVCEFESRRSRPPNDLCALFKVPPGLWRRFFRRFASHATPKEPEQATARLSPNSAPPQHPYSDPPVISMPNKWTVVEELILVAAVKRSRPHDWGQVARTLNSTGAASRGQRTERACRACFCELARATGSDDKWDKRTPEERTAVLDKVLDK